MMKHRRCSNVVGIVLDTGQMCDEYERSRELVGAFGPWRAPIGEKEQAPEKLSWDGVLVKEVKTREKHRVILSYCSVTV